MASSFRRTALQRHSSDSLDRLSFCCRTVLVSLPRLADLAEQFLFERQCLNPPSVPVWCRQSDLLF